MLSHAQEKLIQSLHTKKGRAKTGLCLAEGTNCVNAAKNFWEFTFSPTDTKNFSRLMTTETPQPIAAVARLPQWTLNDLEKRPLILVLDNIQDPGNVGTLFRLALGFDASLLLVDSADPSNPKVIRSSAGAIFQVPYLEVKRPDAPQFVRALQRPIFRLEKRQGATTLNKRFSWPAKAILILGSEGQGITLEIQGQSLIIPHAAPLESLNVASAAAIALFSRNQ